MSDLAIYLNLDQPEPSLRRMLARGLSQAVGVGPWAGGIKLACELYLLDNTGNFRTESGAVDYVPLAVLSYQASGGPVTLAIATEFTPILDALDDSRIGWSFDLELNTDAISTYLGTDGLSKSATLDLSLARPAGDLMLLFRGPLALLYSAFNPAEPTPILLNNTIVVRSDITDATLHKAVVTLGRAKPAVFLTLEAFTWNGWTLRVRTVDDPTNEEIDASADLQALWRVPNDANPGTNNVIWVKTAFV